MKYSVKIIVPTLIKSGHQPYREPPMAIAPLHEWVRGAGGPRAPARQRCWRFALAAAVTARHSGRMHRHRPGDTRQRAVHSGAASDPPPPGRTLSGDVLYKLLVGEFAQLSRQSGPRARELSGSRPSDPGRGCRGTGDEPRGIRARRRTRTRGRAVVDQRRSVERQSPARDFIPADTGRRHRKGGRTPRSNRGDVVRSVGNRISPCGGPPRPRRRTVKRLPPR